MRQPTPEDMEEMEMPEEDKPKCHGMCPVFAIIIVSMICQAVILKKHERALVNLKTLKRAKEIAAENAQKQQAVDVEAAQPQYVPCALVTEEAPSTEQQLNYSFEEPEDKSGSDMVLSFSDNDIKISGINNSSSSITISNNME
jgi:hypothetical protein